MSDHLARVTVDLDGYIDQFELKAVRAYHTLDYIADDIEVRVSSSGTGIHLVGWFDEFLDDDLIEKLRMHLNDDDYRIQLDEVRGASGHTTQVLWVPDSEHDDIYAALDYIRGMRDPVEKFEQDVKAGLIV